MANTYRIGIIGRTGKGDYGHGVDTSFTKLPNVEIIAVADEDANGRTRAQQRTGAAKAYANYRDMLAREKLDIVAICPRWIDQHHEMLMAAAESGCHIYMEKPFCRTLQECDDILNQLEMRHLQLGIAHITQYSPVLDTVLSLIEGDEIGEVLELRGRGKEDHRGGGEDLWVLGSHIFALMRSFAGRISEQDQEWISGHPIACAATVMQSDRSLEQDDEPASHAVTRADVSEGGEGIGPLAGDHVQATYTFANGIFGHFASRRSMGGKPSRFALQVFGSKGVIEMESGYLKPAHILRDPSWSPGRSGKSWETITSAGIGKPETRTDGGYQGGHVAAIKDLMESIEQQRATRCSAEDCRGIIEMIAAVFESHRLGRPVAMPLETRVNPLTLL
jgi:predicted dehydrogenase